MKTVYLFLRLNFWGRFEDVGLAHHMIVMSTVRYIYTIRRPNSSLLFHIVTYQLSKPHQFHPSHVAAAIYVSCGVAYATTHPTPLVLVKRRRQMTAEGTTPKEQTLFAQHNMARKVLTVEWAGHRQRPKEKKKESRPQHGSHSRGIHVVVEHQNIHCLDLRSWF